ncbi:peptide ligase PGM1-related protein [Amycolatopsis sp. A133]|uniref:peptide ligase PGM1-related protein n=1 Tax=Amycolatopsis sp. A133 TaxID=3064472 RepID=UPI0027F2B57D|nr:peptide ligase PGM1-related protein [Amycolatopsis sp. A133]MDQ7808421.1 peptide ligase PGM1-related protein [Amycolatopsis sp. A133]
MKTIIALSAVRYDRALLSRLPYLRFAEERAFSHVGMLRDRTTRLIIIAEATFEDAIVDYYLRDVAGFHEVELPGVKRRIELIQPRQRPHLPLDTLTLHDEPLVARLKGIIKDARQTRLVNFAASADTDLLSQTLGVPAEQAPHNLTQQWGSKSGGKEVLRRSGVPTPGGSANSAYSWQDVAAAVQQLDKTMSGLIAVKLSDPKWGSAVGTVVMNRSTIRPNSSPAHGVVTIRQPWAAFTKEMETGGAIVEEYLDDVISAPSGQAFIDLSGAVQVISTHDQILINDQYMGCISPASEFVATINRHLESVGSTLAAIGIRGHFGVDFIVRATGDLLATEINIRKVGPTHVLAQAKDAVGEATSLHYVHRRVHQPQLLRSFSASGVIEALRDEGLLFERRTRKGVLLHMLNAVSPCGYIETTCIGNSLDEAFDIDQRLHCKLGLRLNGAADIV